MLKYGEALAHSDALANHSMLLMWKFLEIKKICSFFCLLYIDFNHYDQQQRKGEKIGD